MGALGHERWNSRPRVKLSPTLLVTLSSRHKEFAGNLRAVLRPSPRPLPLELNLNRVSTRGLATSAVLHAGVLAVMLALPGIGRNEPFVFEDKPPDVTVIYYPATSLPAIKDSGGSVSGSQGAAGGRAALHPGQTIHVSRAIPMNPAVADAPKLLLPRVPAPTANLLALSASPAALPVLAVPVELARRESKIARPEKMRETKPAADASQLKLQRGKMPDLPPSIVDAAPVLAVPVELTRRESKIARWQRLSEPKPATDALQLKLQRGRMPDLPPSIVDTPAKVALASPVPLPPPPRPVLPKEVATEISSSSTSALQTFPLKPVPAVAEPNVHNEGGASAGKRQELVVSARPGDVIGVPADGKAASLALSPSGNAEPGIGKEGRGIGAARGTRTGSTASGGWTGGSATGSGPGSNSVAKGGVSPEPGPSGAGRGNVSAIPEVDIRGGVVTLDSFGPRTVSGRSPSVATPARKPAPITIVATSRSGGGLAAYGAFKNRTVYTVYVDTTAGQAVLQFAAQESAAVDPAGLTPPDPLSTQTPRAEANPGVVFACVLDERGHLQNLRVVSSSPANPALEEAVRRWIFHPALSGNQPVAVDALIGIGMGVQ